MPLNRFAWLIPMLAGAAAYAMAPWAQLVWDDHLLWQQQIASMQSLEAVLQPPPGIPKWTYAYYRPAVVLSYLLDARLFGTEAAAGPHVMNVLYHLAATLAVWLLSRRLLRHLPNGAFAALAAATLFAVHPIHTESVSWMTGRSDLLATMFLVPAVLAALRWRDEPSVTALLASTALFLLALLSKEVAVAGLLILPVLWLVRPPTVARATGMHHSRAVRRRERADWFPAVALAGGWIAATWYYFSLRQAAGTPAIALPASLRELLLPPARAAAWYLQKLVVPWPQSNFVPWEMVTGLVPALAILAAALLVLGWAVLRWRQSGEGVLFAGLWWLGTAIAPSLSTTLPGLAETPVAERYLYLPSVGLVLAIGAALAVVAAPARARVAGWAVGVLAVAWLAGTWQRGYIWQDDLRLWTDVTRRVTNYGLPWVELGRALDARGDKEAAMEAFQRARDYSTSAEMSAVANFNLGLLNAQRGDMRGASEFFSAAVAADPTYARGHYGLGRVLYQRALNASGRAATERLALIQEAASHLELAVQLNPGFAEAHVALGWIRKTEADTFQEMGNAMQARAGYRAALGHAEIAQRFELEAAQAREAQELRAAAALQLQRLGF
jgi:tetratricopeptide (TPR) repeat protein